MADIAPFPAPKAAESPAANAQTAPQNPAGARPRDPRLDFYRGIAMFIILIAHVPGNAWTSWIPARFGFSDATEIFVFCSGMASAIAFGGSYARGGWVMGTARVLFRCWQVFWAHIGLFFFVAMCMAALDLSGAFDKSYLGSLNLKPFFNNPVPQIVGLFTLTYVPNYFDILPMYLVVLGLLPFIMALEKIHLGAVAAFCVGLWLVANPYLLGFGPNGLSLAAEPWSTREWFFNPFGWQLLFFTGFAFMKGWLPKPPVHWAFSAAAVAFLVLGAPFGSWKVFLWIEASNADLGAMIRKTYPLTSQWREKTDFGLLRYMHFLALAYLAWVVSGDHGQNLIARGQSVVAKIWAGLLAIVTKVGQQSLAVFVFSMALARLIGVALDELGRTVVTVPLANLCGFALIVICAYGAAWFKSSPWRRKA